MTVPGEVDGADPATLQLRGDRLTLRPWRPDDADWVYEQLRDPAYAQFLPVPTPYSPEAARRFVAGDSAAPGGFRGAMVDTADGRRVGSCQLRLDRDGAIGYWVAADARGRGYAAEATRMLVDWGLSHGLTRVALECDVRNLASARTALAAGMRFEGIARNCYLGGGREPDLPELRHDAAVFARVAGDAGGPVAPAFPRLPTGGLTDGTLTLRVTEPDDATALAETEDDVARGFGFYPADAANLPRETARRTQRAGLDWLVGGTAQLSMVDVASGQVAGELSLRRSGPPGVGALGYAVHPAFRGRGFTARALRLVAPWAFGAVGLARLELGAKAGNIASQRAALAGGFRPDGVRPARLRNPDGSMADEVLFALLRPDAAARRPDGVTPAG